MKKIAFLLYAIFIIMNFVSCASKIEPAQAQSQAQETVKTESGNTTNSLSEEEILKLGKKYWKDACNIYEGSYMELSPSDEYEFEGQKYAKIENYIEIKEYFTEAALQKLIKYKGIIIEKDNAYILPSSNKINENYIESDIIFKKVLDNKIVYKVISTYKKDEDEFSYTKETVLILENIDGKWRIRQYAPID